jgi:hypothetical protein
MIMTPKINGYEMQLIEQVYDYTEWQASYNSAGLVIIVKSDEMCSTCNMYTVDQYGRRFFSFHDAASTPQEAADKAADYLNRMANLLKNCGFGLDK